MLMKKNNSIKGLIQIQTQEKRLLLPIQMNRWSQPQDYLKKIKK
jgi:hypothetical protein